MARTALDEFADKLQKVEAIPKKNPADPNERQQYKPYDPAYYNDLANALPEALKAIKFSSPVTGDKLTTQQTGELLAAFSAKLDHEDKIVKDKDGKVVDGYMSSQNAFLIMLHKQLEGEEGKKAVSVSALQAAIRQSPDGLPDKDKENNFQWMMTNVHKGLQGREIKAGQPVWTYEKIAQLAQTIAGGNLKDIQRYMQDASRPAARMDISRMTDAQAAVDLENPKVKGIVDLAASVRESVISKFTTPAGSTQGPISQAAYEALVASKDEKAIAFFKDQPRLETVLDEELGSPEFAAEAARQGITGDQLKQLKSSIGNNLLGSELPMKIMEGLEGRRVYMTLMDKKNGTEMAARDFAATLNDPDLTISLGRDALAGHFRDSLQGQGLSEVPGNYAWNLAEAAGFDLGRTSRGTFLRTGPEGGFATMNPDGLPLETQKFMAEVYKTTSETMLEVRGYADGGKHSLDTSIKTGVLPPDLKEFEGKPQKALIEHLAARRMEEKIRANPEWRAKMSSHAEAVKAEETALAKFPKAQGALFDDEHFDVGSPMAAENVNFDTPAMISIKAGGSTLLLKTGDNDLKVFTPKVTPQGAGGPGVISFEPSAMSGHEIREAIQHTITSGGTIKTRMLAEQDGKADGKAMPIGVQVILEKDGKVIGNAVIGFDSIDINQSNAFLKTLKEGLDQKGPDNKGPGMGYTVGGLETQGRQQVQAMQIPGFVQ
jgi:hypothetical protein